MIPDIGWFEYLKSIFKKMKTKLHSALLALMIVSSGFISLAQTPYYSFSQYTSAYADLPSPISINGSTVWDYSGSSSAYFPLDIATLVSYFEVFGDMNNNMRVWGGVLQFYHNGFQQLYYINGFGFFSPDGMKDKGTSSSSVCWSCWLWKVYYCFNHS